jgi:DNA-binding transcriptional regulator GbsR (MarR family)
VSKKVESKRLRSAHQTDQEILAYLKAQEKPVTFYNLYKDLNFSSGKVQTALKRLQKKNQVFLKKRIKRFENLVYHKDFDVKSDVIDLELENEIIFPIHLNRTIGNILQEIPELSLEYVDLKDLFKKAIINFFQKEISHDLRNEAIKQAIVKGKISEALGEQILGV